MNIIFKVTDKTGRKIRLTKRQWTHIVDKHPDMAGKQEEIMKTLEIPEFILPEKFNEKMQNYYKYNKSQKEYLLVVVKYLNGDGFIATSFYTRKIRK